MSEQTKIAWCDSTINFWEGCTKVSPGCTHCYAEARDKRFTGGKLWGKGSPRRKSKSAVKDAMAFNRKPWICDGCGAAYASTIADGKFEVCDHCLQINGKSNLHRRRVFSLSLGDWLDEEVPIGWLAEMLDTIRQCDKVTWILCSKRWQNFKERMAFTLIHLTGLPATPERWKFVDWIQAWVSGRNIPTNIIGLCSVENQESADSRIPHFLTVPLVCHGLSLEPLLGPVELNKWIYKDSCGCDENEPEAGDGFRCKHCKDTHAVAELDWLIIGGESGPHARPCNVEWIRSLVDQGKVAGVPVFIKQLGAKPEGPKWSQAVREMGNFGRLDWSTMLDKKGGDPAEWPAELRIRQFPRL